MSSYATITTPTLPTANLSSPADVSSDIWGKVYQNYISTNLSSEQLAKGAYDAYNLLTTEKLKEFSEKTVASLATINTNVTNIDAAIQTNFDTFNEVASACYKLFHISRIGEHFLVDAQAKNYIAVPTADDKTSEDVYDLTSNVTLDFASSGGKGDYKPGLLKGIDFAKFRSVADKFDTTSITGSSWVTGSANSLAAQSTPMDVLVFKINQLQLQVSTLEAIINELFSENSTHVIGKLNVKHINFVSSATSSVDLASSTNTAFIDPNIIKVDY